MSNPVSQPIKWLGQRICDFCHDDCIIHGRAFVDGKTWEGSWALMCRLCHIIHGVGLGPGRGQMYDGLTYEKIEG